MTLQEFLKRHGEVLVRRLPNQQPVGEPYRATWCEPGQRYVDDCHAIGCSPEQAITRLDGYLHRRRLSSYADPAKFESGASCDYCAYEVL